MFLRGDTLNDCYAAVAEVANHWMEVLYSKGGDLDDDELMELISQNKTMSQTLEEYGTAKVNPILRSELVGSRTGSEQKPNP